MTQVPFVVVAVKLAAQQPWTSDVQLLNSDPVMLASCPVLGPWLASMLGLAAVQCQEDYPHESAVAAVGHSAYLQNDAFVVVLLVVTVVMSAEAAAALLAVTSISVIAE